MKSETSTMVNENVVMMATRPLMFEVDIVPRGLDSPGNEEGLGSAMLERIRQDGSKEIQCANSGRSN